MMLKILDCTFYLKQAEVHGVARGISKTLLGKKSIFLAFVTRMVPMGLLKQFSQFDPTIADNMGEELYFIHCCLLNCTFI